MPIHDWPWPFAIRIFNSGGDRPPLPTKFCGCEDRKILRLLPLIYAILPRRCRRGSHQAINRFIIAHLFWLCKYFLRYFQYFLCVFLRAGSAWNPFPRRLKARAYRICSICLPGGGLSPFRLLQRGLLPLFPKPRRVWCHCCQLNIC